MEKGKKYKVQDSEDSYSLLEDPAVAVSCGEMPFALNPVQRHLLRMFSYDGSEERLMELKQVLTKYYSGLLDKELNALWDSGDMSQEKLDELWDVDVRKI